MKKVLIIVLLCMVFLSGCASTEKVALNKDIRISSISVSENVIVPKDIYYVGEGAAFGLIGGLANVSPAKAFQEFTIKNHIDIKKIVRNTFIKTLEQAGKYPYSENAKFQIDLTVKVYGVSKKSMFSDDYLPVLLIQAKMTDGTKNTIWKNGYYIQPLGNPIAPVSMKRINENPELLKKLWTDAAAAASKKIIEPL